MTWVSLVRNIFMQLATAVVASLKSALLYLSPNQSQYYVKLSIIGSAALFILVITVTFAMSGSSRAAEMT